MVRTYSTYRSPAKSSHSIRKPIWQPALLQAGRGSSRRWRKLAEQVLPNEPTKSGTRRKSRKMSGSPAAPSHPWAMPPAAAALRGTLGELPQTRFFTPDFHVPVELLMPRHADIETRAFPSLADLIGQRHPPKRALKICIATFVFEGPTKAEGLAVEYRKLAELLKRGSRSDRALHARPELRAGHDRAVDRSFCRGRHHFGAASPTGCSRRAWHCASALARSRAAYEWLKQQDFDLVHGAAAHGALFVALTAKRLGLAFENTLFVVEAWPPTMWALQVDAQPIGPLRNLAVSYSERKSVELADVVVSPSRHMLRWMMRHGYDLPLERSFVQPPLVGAAGPAATEARVQKAISELVFVGSFDSRKGIGALSRAAESLKDEFPDLVITYLAQPSARFSLKEKLLKASHARIVETKKPGDALAYLTGEGRVAILPSHLDRAPGILADFVPHVRFHSSCSRVAALPT